MAGLTVFALLAAFVALFVVASTFALSVQQRHRELALFRAIGCTPRQVRRMVAGEALLVAIAATVVAAPIAVLAAWLELGPFTRAGMVPEGLHLAIGWLPFVAGLGIAIVTTQIAAFASARRAARIRPTDALREASVQRRPLTLLRGLAGLAALAGGIAVVTASGGGSEDSAPAATMVWMVAVALLGPLLALPFVWLIGLPLAGLSRGPGLLARANARANLRRVASVATPMVLAVSLVATVFFGKAMLQQQATRQTADRTTANLVLSAPSAAGLSPGLDAAVRQVPGIRQASGTLATSVIVAADGANLRAFPARGVDAASLTGVVDLGVASGSLSDLHGNALAVGTDGATRFGWHLGDRVRLWLGDGTPVTLRVAATFTRPLGFAEIVLPRALVAGHVTHPLDDAVFVTSAPAARRASVITRLEAFAHRYPGLEVSTRAQYRRQLASAAAPSRLRGVRAAGPDRSVLRTGARQRHRHVHRRAESRVRAAPPHRCGATADLDDDPRRDADHRCLRSGDGHARGAPRPRRPQQRPDRIAVPVRATLALWLPDRRLRAARLRRHGAADQARTAIRARHGNDRPLIARRALRDRDRSRTGRPDSTCLAASKETHHP